MLDNFMAYSFYGTVVESTALYFIFYRSDLLRFSIFCMGSPARIVCSVKLSHFLFLFLCSVFLGRSTWDFNSYYFASFRNFLRNDKYRTDVGNSKEVE